MKESVEQQEQETGSFYKVSCSHCKKAHRPCDRKLPSCARCLGKGLHCEYHPPKKRKRQSTSNTSRDNQIVKVMKSDGDSVSAKTALDKYFLHTTRSAQQLNTIPAIVSLMTTHGADFEAKVQKAQWYNTSALILYHAPMKRNSPQQTTTRNYFRIMSLFNKEITGDIGKLEEITNSYSRLEILDASQYLYNIARQKILDPDLFVRIATDYKLAEVCVGLCTYVLGKEGDINEAKLYMSMFKVFVDNTKSVLNIDLSVFSESQREELSKLQDKTRQLSLYSLSFEAYLRQMELMKSKGTDRLHLCIEAMERMQKMYSGIGEMRAYSTILRLPGTAGRLTSFLQLCDSLAQDTRIWSKEERLLEDNPDILFVIRKISFKAIKIMAIYTEQDQPDCMNLIELEEIKRSVTQETIEYIFDNMEIYLMNGSLNYSVLIIAVDNLLSQGPVNHYYLSTYLSLLQKSKLLIDALLQKYLTKSLEETSAALEAAMEKIEKSEPSIILGFSTTNLAEEYIQIPVEDNKDFLNEWLLQHSEESSAEFFLDMQSLDFTGV